VQSAQLSPATRLDLLAADVASLRERVFDLQDGAHHVAGHAAPALHDALVAAANELGAVEMLLAERRRSVRAGRPLPVV
jgi:hypothetical protein